MKRKPLSINAMVDSKETFEAAYREHSPRITRFLLSRTQDPQLADDLTSTVFEKAWRSRRNFQGGSVAAWLTRIARNTLTDHWRKKKDIAIEDFESYESDQAQPDAALDAQLRLESLRRAVADLPPIMKTVITRRFIDGQSAKSVARELNTTDGNIRIIQYRALQRMRRTIE
jgi:RNA polymerase sigma-70 factor (ECF subfamily)